ncbi:MAG: hypothetical protein IH852_13315 [Bacteroidetes bacterium]|nr:hypothetical protein [Bacteroidota bacterium]
MKSIKLFLFIIVINSPILCQVEGDIWDQEQISNITVLLHQQINDSLASIGSGTIVNHQNTFYLLTATHIAKKIKNNAKIVFRLDNDKPDIVDLIQIVKDNKLTWDDHSVADISIIELVPHNEKIKKRLETWSFPSNLINNGENLPERAADITFLGFPVLDMKMNHFSPLIFKGYRSSGLITQKRADTNTASDFYYLNVPSIQGCSGSGVYISVKNGMYLSFGKTIMIGIVHGTHGDNTGGKMAAITPSYYIFDLFK